MYLVKSPKLIIDHLKVGIKEKLSFRGHQMMQQKFQ
jgi:hypothetical protein